MANPFDKVKKVAQRGLKRVDAGAGRVQRYFEEQEARPTIWADVPKLGRVSLDPGTYVSGAVAGTIRNTRRTAKDPTNPRALAWTAVDVASLVPVLRGGRAGVGALSRVGRGARTGGRLRAAGSLAGSEVGAAGPGARKLRAAEVAKQKIQNDAQAAARAAKADARAQALKDIAEDAAVPPKKGAAVAKSAQGNLRVFRDTAGKIQVEHSLSGKVTGTYSGEDIVRGRVVVEGGTRREAYDFSQNFAAVNRGAVREMNIPTGATIRAAAPAAPAAPAVVAADAAKPRLGFRRLGAPDTSVPARKPKDPARSSGKVKTRKGTSTWKAAEPASIPEKNLPRSAKEAAAEAAAAKVAEAKPVAVAPVIAPKPRPGFRRGVAEPKPAAKSTVAVPKPAASAPAVETAAPPKATIVSDIADLLKAGSIERGALVRLAKKRGVSRQRVQQKLSQARKRALAPASPPSTPKSVSAPAAAPQTKAQSVAARKTQPAAPATAAAPTSAVAPAPAPASAPVAVAPAPQKAIRLKRAATSGATAPTPSGTTASKVADAALRATGLKPFPKKTAAVVGASYAVGAGLSVRDKVGFPKGAPQGDGSAPAAMDWTESLPEGLRENVRALIKVQEERGEEGLSALREGLSQAERDPEYRAAADLNNAHLSAEYAETGKLMPPYAPKLSPEERMNITLVKMRKKRDDLLRREVSAAYKRIQLQNKNERLRRS